MKNTITNVDNFILDVVTIFRDNEVISDVKRSLDHLFVLVKSADDVIKVTSNFNRFNFQVLDKPGNQIFYLSVEPNWDGSDVEVTLNNRSVALEEAMESIKKHYNGSVKLESSDYKTMMDFAMDMNDKEWFDELHSRQQKAS